MNQKEFVVSVTSLFSALLYTRIQRQKITDTSGWLLVPASALPAVPKGEDFAIFG